MSGFLLAEALAKPLDVSQRFHFVSRDRALPWQAGPCSSQIIRQDEENLWSPTTDPASGTSLAIYGRVRLEPAEWSAAKSLPLNGGLAARHLLDCWLTDGEPGLLNAYNGAATLLLWDATNRNMHLWTDRAGVVPVYLPAHPLFALCSHPDVLADWLIQQGTTPNLDIGSLAELLSTGAVSPPYSFYKEIRLLEAASHFVWHIENDDTKAQLHSQTLYWTPEAIDENLSVAQASEGIATALRAACQRQTPGKTVLLLSGGADSRGLLFAHQDPSAVQCLTFCDSENPEVARAKEVAAAAGAAHQILFRDPEHYGLGAMHTVRVTGGMGSIKDAHFQGFQSNFESHEPASLVTGCYADYLLKGLALNRQSYQFMGRALPLEKLAAYDEDFYQQRYHLHEKWDKIVSERCNEHFGKNAAQRYASNPRSIEDLRVRPLTREADSVGRLFLLGTQSWDPVFVDNDLLEFYGRLSPELKINSRAFAPAVLRLLPKAAHSIPNNNEGQFPLGTPPWMQLTLGAAGLLHTALMRHLNRKATEQLASWCSWPNFAYYLTHSEVLGDMLASWSSSEKQIFQEILGFDPANRTRSQWVPETGLLLRLLTLKLWLKQRGY